MNPEKWKSVVIPIESYRLLKQIAEHEHRTLRGQFTHLLLQYGKPRKSLAWTQRAAAAK